MTDSPNQPAARRPRVTLYAVGGTIAGSAASRTNTTDYQVGIGADELIAAVPEIAQIADVRHEQLANVASSDVGTTLLLQLSKTVSAALQDPDTDGVVITHGTDTLPESAFFLDLTVQSDKPVVFVGAMRPASAVSADGPANLLKAVALAGSAEARGRGVLIALNDRIGSAFYTNKTHSTSVETFRADEQGSLGVFINTRPRFWYAPATPLAKPHFDVSRLETLPKVAILYAYQDQDDLLIDAAIQNGAQGIVIAASGHGSVSIPTKQRIRELEATGFPVVRATRTGNGIVAEKPEGIGAGVYSVTKARWLLALALASGASLAQIRALFTA
ncbi:asparaginase [Pseudomonadota bacterium AL_CKDN230030165-1A_HGKHYDSX7]